MDISKSTKIAFLLIGILTVIGLCYLAYLSFVTPNKLPLLSDLGNPSQADQSQSPQLSSKNESGVTSVNQEFFEKAKEITIDEIAKSDPDLAKGTGLVTTQDKKKFDEVVLNNREPQNHFVEFIDGKLATSKIEIMQGDYVTLVNTTLENITVIRQIGDTSTTMQIGPNGSLSYGFDFLGTHNFVVGNSQLMIVVKKFE